MYEYFESTALQWGRKVLLITFHFVLLELNKLNIGDRSDIESIAL
jgi:hypothetical protein